jgi:hypothetical protein
MNWTVTISQLAVTGIMTILRVLVRRGLVLDTDISEKLPNGYELDHVAKDLHSCKNWDMISQEVPEETVRAPESVWNRIVERERVTEEMISARCRLGQLSGWEGRWTKEANTIATAVETAMNFFFSNKDINITGINTAKDFSWELIVQVSIDLKWLLLI